VNRRRIRLVLWDVMDTLVHDPFRDVMPAFFGLELRDLLRLKSPTAWIRFERGTIDEAAYFAQAFCDGRPFDGPAFREAMLAGCHWLPGMEPLLGRVAATGVPMVALSNYPVWFERLDERFGFSRALDAAWVSFRTGHRKPAPEAYLGPARAYGIAPEGCLFIDDREENVAAARALGMAGERFVDAPTLAAALATYGLVEAPGPA
jgi:FMN phosphatase YigB (HAD superfamily)